MDVFLARQPIFDKKQNVFAYELLYRSNRENIYTNIDGNQASSEVISNSLLLFGLDNLTGGKKAFINFTRKMLEDETATLLPRESIVVEILEDVEPDEKMLSACTKLKKMGYMLALDDFIYDPRFDPFIDLVDIIKVDFLQSGIVERKALIRKLEHKKIKLLAEKIETIKDFQHASEKGYSYFQGFFFSKPNIVTGKDITGFKHTYLQLLQEISRADMDFDQVENIIKRDVALSFKLLRFINSVAFSFRLEINSIKQALVLLGQKEILKWVALIALKNISGNKPDELMTLATIRARFCELIAIEIGFLRRSQDFFLMGMFSLIDAFLDQPLAIILAQLPIAEDIKSGLLGDKSLIGEVMELAIAYEKGDWQTTAHLGEKFGLTAKGITNIYLDSLSYPGQLWAD